LKEGSAGVSVSSFFFKNVSAEFLDFTIDEP
jgi:hypothetical protein